MPLKIQLRKGQKIIINGAILENASQRNVSLLVINDASILRDSDIAVPEDAATPASRTYYSLQCAYIFPEKRDDYLRQFTSFLDSYVQAAPSSRPIAESVRGFVDKGDYYHALKKAQELIFHERDILANVQKNISREIRDHSATGEPAGD